jgi:hypothetical protein
MNDQRNSFQGQKNARYQDRGNRREGFRNPITKGRGPASFINLIENNNKVYKELRDVLNLEVQLGVNACFYVNKLNHSQFNSLVETIPDDNLKDTISDKLKSGKQVNWISTSFFSENGIAPCDELKRSIETYNSFELDDSSRRMGIYGEASISVDFSKLDLIKASDGFPLYPFGVMFFSDSYSSYDKCSLTVSTADNRMDDASRCHYINPISYSQGAAVCSGKFRYSGNFIIFYVDKDIEKLEGAYYPDITIINIPVATARRHDDKRLIERTGITGVLKGNSCVSDIIMHLKGVFDFYHVEDKQLIGEIIHAVGYDPVKYNYPPSVSDPRSSYYGGNRARLGSKGNDYRFEKASPGFNRPPNIFSYLESINQTNVASTNVLKDESRQDSEEDVGGELCKCESESAFFVDETPYSVSEVDEALDCVAEPQDIEDEPVDVVAESTVCGEDGCPIEPQYIDDEPVDEDAGFAVCGEDGCPIEPQDAEEDEPVDEEPLPEEDGE